MDVDKLVKMGEAGKLDELEVERQRMLDQLLSTIDDPERRIAIQQLHFNSSNMRFKYKNPIVCMVKSSKAMIDSLGDLNKKLDELRSVL